ncbi:prominin-like protein [Drosophila miranda]|uniref:prominin-like protein n=1 Tax=Drosophila miranda TaxID=7229 RepID=UPI0007E6ECBC|nr:prominin-like protein [Drosophila miranda]XP_033243135.1 prominin-like protein [Drosophila miranda]
MKQHRSNGILDLKMSKYGKQSLLRLSLAALLLFVLWLQICAAARSRPPRPTPRPNWRKGYTGDGTTHEQMGLVHFSEAKLSKFNMSLNYTKTENYTRKFSDLFKWSRGIYDKFFPLNVTVPRGYLRFVGTEKMTLGRKVDRNDWAAWFAAYWLFWLWASIIVALIVLMPFLGVLYCCFCCCRCKQGCPPCDIAANRRRRFIWGTCLALIIVMIGLCMALAVYSNSLLERGLAKTKRTLEKGSLDTCTFLYGVQEHIEHLFVKNFEELETHLTHLIMNAPRHIANDLNDASGANSIQELKYIFGNLRLVEYYTEDTINTHVDIVANAIKLREALRGVKRDINYAATVLCGSQECIKFLGRSDIEFIDTSRCLHADKIPSVRAIQQGLKALFRHEHRPDEALARLHEITVLIKEEMERVAAPMIRDIKKGKKLFADQADRINEIIDVVISDIHLATLRSTRAFDDLYVRFDRTRNYVIVSIAIFVAVILAVLIIALAFGCFGKRVTGVRDNGLSRRIGSHFILLAMLLIVCVISIMLMMGLCYFLIGAVAYKGACAPLSEKQRAARERLISEIKLQSDVSSVFSSRRDGSKDALKISNIINECEGANSIFKYLRENRIYDVDDLIRVRVMTPMEADFTLFQDLDLSDFFLLTPSDIDVYSAAANSSLDHLHPDLWFDTLCYEYVPIDFENLRMGLKKLAHSLPWNYYQAAKAAFENEYENLETFHKEYTPILEHHIVEALRYASWTQRQIEYEYYSFGDSIRLLLKNILSTEMFIRDMGKHYLANIGKNLTTVIQQQINNYIKMVVHEANTKVGHCQPLTYIYDYSLDTLCSDLVDPIIGCWLGILVSAFLLLSVLCIGHRLQCLYKQIQTRPRPFVVGPKKSPSCPYCIGRSERLAGGDPGGSGGAARCPCGLQDDFARAAILDVEQAIEAPTNHPMELPLPLPIRDPESSTDGKNKLD